MDDRPITPAPGPDPELGALMLDYPDWDAEVHDGHLTFTHRSPGGRSIRVLVAFSVREMRGKLATASVVEP